MASKVYKSRGRLREALPRNSYEEDDDEDEEDPSFKKSSSSSNRSATSVCLTLVSVVLLCALVAGLTIYVQKSDQTIREDVNQIHHRVSRLDLASDNVTVIEGPAGKDGVNGTIGPTGPTGPQGEAGIQGPIGPTGPQGEMGLQGAVGPTGPVGATGPQGEVGPVGATGPQGPAGANGSVGATGPQGPQGEVGPTGPAGANGSTGATGPAGPQGEVGPQGPIGPAGTNGTDGAVGPTGPQGEVGPAGPAGATGATGPQGPIGPQGDAGPQGVVGPTGPTGPTGDTGPTCGVSCTAFTVDAGGGTSYALTSATDKFQLVRSPGSVVVWESTPSLSAWVNGSLTATGTVTANAVDGGAMTGSSLNVSTGAITGGALSATTGSFSSTLAVTGVATFSNNVTAGSLAAVTGSVTTLSVSSTSSFLGAMTVANNIVVTGTMSVTGVATFSNNVIAGGGIANARMQVTGGGLAINSGMTSSSSRPALSTSVGAYEIRAHASTFSNDGGFLRLSAGGGSDTSRQTTIELAGYTQSFTDMDLNIVMRTAGTERFRINSAGAASFTSSLSAAAITGTSLSAGSGTVSGGAATFTSVAGGTITGSSVNVSSGAITGGAITGTSLSAGSGSVTGGAATFGSVTAVSFTATGDEIMGVTSLDGTFTRELSAQMFYAYDLRVFETGIAEFLQPGTSPTGSRVDITSPGGDPGIAITRGNGAGGVLRRYDLKVNSDSSFVIRDNNASVDRVTLSSTGVLTTGPISIAGNATTFMPVVELSVAGTTAKGRVFQAVGQAGSRVDVGANLMYNGTAYNRDDTGNAGALLTISALTPLQFRYVAAGANPATLTTIFTVWADGATVFGSASTYNLYPFTVSSSVNNRIAAFVQTQTGEATIEIARTGGTASSWQWYIPSGSTNLQLWSGNSGSTGVRMTFAADGRVGIGGAPITNFQFYVTGGGAHFGDSVDTSAYGYVQIVRPAAQGNSFHQSFIRNGNAVLGMGFLSSSNTFGIQHGLDNTGSSGIFVTNGGQVGVGDRAPNNRLEVAGGGLRVQGSISNTASGVGLELWSTGSATYVGSYNRGTSTYIPIVIYGADIRFEIAGTVRAYIDSSGNFNPWTTNQVNLGSSSLKWKEVFAVAGAINTSDRRSKKNIRDSVLGLRFIRKLRPVNYQFKDTTSVQNRTVGNDTIAENVTSTDPKHYEGLIAQEVYETLTELNVTAVEFAGYYDPAATNQTGDLGLRYTEFITPLIKAVQELDVRTRPVEGAPLSSTSPCQVGEQRFTTEYLFTCIRENQWGRSNLDLHW